MVYNILFRIFIKAKTKVSENYLKKTFKYEFLSKAKIKILS